MLVNFDYIHLYSLLFILVVSLAILWVKTKNLSYVIFCAVFGIYLIGAISVTVFPFYIGEPRPDFLRNLNLVPFDFGSCFQYMPEYCRNGIFKNILLAVPFGFLIPFIAPIKPKHTVPVILAIGCSFEFIQLVMAFILRNSFRAIDINDVIFNTLGAFVGYLLFKLFGWFYELAIQKYRLRPKHIFDYIHQTIASHIT